MFLVGAICGVLIGFASTAPIREKMQLYKRGENGQPQGREAVLRRIFKWFNGFNGFRFDFYSCVCFEAGVLMGDLYGVKTWGGETE